MVEDAKNTNLKCYPKILIILDTNLQPIESIRNNLMVQDINVYLKVIICIVL